MRSIDIKTAHNIVLTFGLASIGTRAAAFVLDGLIMSLIYMAAILVAGPAMGLEIAYVLVIVGVIFYHLVQEVFFNGQSLGKRIMKIRVVALNGSNLDIKASIIRWAIRPVDFTFTIGALGIMSAYSSDQNQRLGDRLAGTTVIHTGTTDYRSLEDILRIHDTEHTVTYPQVDKYTDQEMILVKHTLDRLTQEPHAATASAARKLAQTLARDLKITDRPASDKQFLTTLLRDYIYLTR